MSDSTKAKGGSGSGMFSDAEKEAMQELVRERRAAKGGKTEGLADLLAKIAEMPRAEAAIAQRLHDIVMTNAPMLTPKTWYGMPAWARDGKVVCFFKPASKYKERYATFGFDTAATLDEGSMWPTSWALLDLTGADEERIAALVKKAVS